MPDPPMVDSRGAAPPSRSSSQRLRTPVQFVPGVGPQRAELLQRLQLRTAADLLFQFPRTYQDFSQVQTIDTLEEGQTVSVCGVVEELDQRGSAAGKVVSAILVRDATGYLRATWFNQPQILQRFRRGHRIMLSGAPKLSGLRWEMVHPRIQDADQQAALPEAEILPVYPLTEGLKQSHMRKILRAALREFLPDVEDVLPASFQQQHRLLPIQDALANIHFPRDADSLQQARRRFVFQELLVMQLALAQLRDQQQLSRRAPRIVVTPQIDARIRRLFPFALTSGQELAVRQLRVDLDQEFPMNRLLQGDVGSGKTAIAVYALLATVAGGYQAALMVPTEVLARQHYQVLQTALAEARVRLALWTGTLTASQRRQTQAAITAGEVDIVVGTQALVQGEIQFPRLGLVVIDEQHKFGVEQRARLREAGTTPHYLVMTATPIPRTVAMVAYGDLDVTCIRDGPPGRQPVHTYLVAADQRERWWEFYRQQLQDGRQGYVITPRLDEGGEDDVTSLTEAFESLAHGQLEAFRLDWIHGRMPAAEKSAAMQAFRDGKTQVLVATSVIEVGIDVPRATVMTIENAERFGLSQLHQMRGRVGRGGFPGYVALFTPPQLDADRRQRLEAFVNTADGFKLAELDFQLRGPGDLLGRHQHGLPPLRIADLQRDEEVLQETRRVARQLIAGGEWQSSELQKLRQQVLRRYADRFPWGDVG